MIGNEIEFIMPQSIDDMLARKPSHTNTGVVVDAFTDVSGIIKGETAFGFGSVSGKTESSRIYKVQYFESYDREKKRPQFINIQSWRVQRIITFAGQTRQEENEEKFR